ncbi:family 35 glycosyl hydrolase [Coniochaeta sp. 2T2.1]|nr:family 35 glycosyl hydrolase [Coniochaeta sp. 2T2.1]
MRLQVLIAAVLGWVSCAAATSNNLTDLVEWDKYSLTVNGTRVYISSAEFHYQRLPVPELWLDVFHKFKANGFNTISVYFFWSYHSPSKGVYDFETPGKNIQQLFDYAKEAGLWVIARAGPYCNAETNGGGLALWGSDGTLGNLRTGDETYHQAWLPWVQAVGKIIADNQITKGGPVILNQIENEYQETVYSPTHTAVIYMEQLKKAFKEAGIVVPITHNEKGMRSMSWSTDYMNVGGAVDVYALDSYPGGLSCTNVNTGFNVVRSYYQWFSNYSFTQPSYLAEFEGGWFSAWGDKTFYDDCQTEHDPAFADVYYKNNIGQRVNLLSIYMTFGGTNWGHSAAPVVYTSYDYSAPLRETREQWSKLFQTKLVNMFATSSPELLTTYMVGNGTGYRVSNENIWSWVLKNPTSGTTFTVLQQAKTPSRDNVTGSVTLDTSAGMVSVPDVSLYGRQSKILVTDYTFGSHKLLYATADILTNGVFDTDVLVLYLKAGQTGHLAFKDEKDLTFTATGDSKFTSSKNETQQVFTWTQSPGWTAVKLSNGVLLYLLSQETAWRFWAPPTTLDPYPTASQKLFVLGPYLVRSASISHQVLHVSGDSDVSTTLEAYVGSTTQIQTIVWNGIRLPATKTPYGSYTASIPGAESRTVSLPSLDRWYSADALPEADPSYDDSRWVVCNKTTTRSPVAPLTLPVLFSSDYGYYVGPKIYRGYFPSSSSFTSVNLTASGGLAFGWSAWLNGIHIGSHPGDAAATTTSLTLALPPSALNNNKNGSANVLTILVDYHGHDQTSTAKGVENPRGLLGATLSPGGTPSSTGFTTWKIQGNAGGAAAYLDPVRGPLNEGGLFPERMSFHLPGFSPSSSSLFSSPGSTSSPLVGLTQAGLKFYTTTFRLNIDSDLDVPLGIELSAPAGTTARVMFWVNGYQYGKYIPHIGPQTRFPVPPGVINNRGLNTLALSLWAQDDEGARLDGVRLFAYGRYQSGFGFNRDWSRLQPGWEDDRVMYA